MNTRPLELSEGLRRELVEIISLRIIQTDINPMTGSAMGNAMHEKLILFYDCLTRISCKYACAWHSDRYQRIIHQEVGEVRKSYDQITQELESRYSVTWTERTVIRFTRILEAMKLIYRTHENKCGKASSLGALLKRPINYLYEFKTLMLNFEPLEEFYERMSIDHELERINQEPEYVPGPPEVPIECYEQQENWELAEAYFADSEPDSTPTLHNETESEKFVNQCGSSYTTDSEAFKAIDSSSATGGQILLPKENQEISPALSDEWQIEIADGGVNRVRELSTFAELPENPKGEYYANWIGERTGLYWAPWIVWDIDDKSSLITALDRTRTLVRRLQQSGVPSSALRVVFSTRKGFHVYLDSRTIGLKPSKNLHKQLQSFCGRFAPCDESLYTLRRIIGIPNSKHRHTGEYYSIVPDIFSISIVGLRDLSQSQHPVPAKAERMQLVPALIEQFNDATKPVATGFPSTSRLQQVVNGPLPAWFGVTEGNRDHATYHMANYFKRSGLWKDAALVLCLDANRRNNPPLDPEIVKEKVERVYNQNSIAVEN